MYDSAVSCGEAIAVLTAAQASSLKKSSGAYGTESHMNDLFFSLMLLKSVKVIFFSFFSPSRIGSFMKMLSLWELSKAKSRQTLPAC